MALKVTAHNIPAATVGLILIKQKTQIKIKNHTLLLSVALIINFKVEFLHFNWGNGYIPVNFTVK